MKARYLSISAVILFATSLLFAVLSEAKVDPETVAGLWLFDDNGWHFNGLIDEVAIFSVALGRDVAYVVMT